MISQQECENIILEAYQKDPSAFKDNPSLFKNKVWGANEDTCFSYFNKSPGKLKEFLDASTSSASIDTQQEQAHNVANT